jgi:small subunit ribosomal protein S8
MYCLLATESVKGLQFFSADQVLSPYVYVFYAAYIVALIFTPVVRHIAIHYDIIDRPDGIRKMHTTPMAYLGGVAVLLELARVLKEEGYIKNFKLLKDRKQGIVRVYLKYSPDESRVINGLKRVSSPGNRVYVGADEIPRVMGGLGVAIISTSKGVMADNQSRKMNMGGEVLCYIW